MYSNKSRGEKFYEYIDLILVPTGGGGGGGAASAFPPRILAEFQRDEGSFN